MQTEEYSLWNVPVNPDQEIPDEDKWLFDQPFHTFQLYALSGHIDRKKQHLVGESKIEAKVVLRKRTVTFGDYEDA